MIQLGSLFSDGAVLQRNIPLPVWGKTAPGTIVRVCCGGAEGYAKSSSAGRFTVMLPALPAGGPFELTVSAGEESLTLRDILVGEVWLASGQSNMSYTLNTDVAVNRPAPGEVLLSRAQEKEFIDTIRDPDMVRLIHVPEVASGAEEESFSAAWCKMTKENAPAFCAVGAWFARKLQETLRVPVGIIVAAWGGTIVETWSSRSALMQNPVTAAMLCEADANMRKEEAWSVPYEIAGNCLLEKYHMEDTGNEGFAKGYASLACDDTLWRDMIVPGSWLQQKISGNGVIWARLAVQIPSAWEKKPLRLRLGPVDKQDTTYFNGKEVGRTGKDFETEHWNEPRNYCVPAELVRSGKAIIAIRAYSFMYDGSLGGGVLENPETKETISLNGLWKVFVEADRGHFRPNSVPELRFHQGNPNLPATLFNSMIRPLIPYAMRGVIWYQGESNADVMSDAAGYAAKLGAMIADWRSRWAQGNFPFIQMLLAGYRMPKSFSTEDIWPTLRSEQLRLCREMPQVFAASALDIGDAKDIHPLNKKEAGQRMALAALAGVYHLPGVVAGGPRLKECRVENDSVRLEFENAAGLAFRGGEAKGFTLLGSTANPLPVEKVSIEGDALRLTWRKNHFPRELYYSWADNPDGTLENGAGLPADPFHLFIANTVN